MDKRNMNSENADVKPVSIKLFSTPQLPKARSSEKLRLDMAHACDVVRVNKDVCPTRLSKDTDKRWIQLKEKIDERLKEA